MTTARLPMFESTFASYEAHAVLGEGGSGRVYAVRDADGAEFALKWLRPDRVTSDKLKRFRNEIAFCEKSYHPGIVRVLDHGYCTAGRPKIKTPFYVMERYAGTLRTVKVASADVLSCFAQLLQAIEAAHLKNVVHRDLKPENVLYNRTANRFVVADFGVAHFDVDELATLIETTPHARLANFRYAAPEQRVHRGQVDHRADIYALGLILNELFTGAVIQGAGYQLIGAQHPEFAYLDPIVERMVQHNPANRFASLAEVKGEISARAQIAMAEQRVSAITGEVVPATSDDSDPLIRDPVRIVDRDYRSGTLVMTLNHITIPPMWVEAFRRSGASHYLDAAPEQYEFYSNRASIRVSEHHAPAVFGQFKEHVDHANRNYDAMVRTVLAEEARNAEAQQRERVAAEERRLKVLKQLPPV